MDVSKSRPKPKVALSIPHWADKVKKLLLIQDNDPQKSDKIWQFDATELDFRSGSKVNEENYLRLRVIWYDWQDVRDFDEFMRDKSSLARYDGDLVTNIPYTGYVSEDNDKLATRIYKKLEHTLEGYLKDVGSDKQPTRPSLECGPYLLTRYTQALVMSCVKQEGADDEDSLPVKIQKLIPSVEGITASMAATSISGPPKTPPKQIALTELEADTPAVPRSFPSVGGKQNPPTSDESYVNTAILQLLQVFTLSMARLDEELNIHLKFDELDWLLDRLLLRLFCSQAKSGTGNKGQRVALMKARVDGYLCKRDYQPPDENGHVSPLYNNLPLAIIEAKPCVRASAGSAIRWQESAEMACWVSSLSDDYENYGLLQSSTSGRKRRLLISQNRREIYIIIAEYGDGWKDYVRTGKSATQPTNRTRDDAANLMGSDAFVQNSQKLYPVQFGAKVDAATADER